MNKIKVETNHYNEELPFVLFMNCLLIRGFRRSIIYDTGRSEYHFIPNDLYDILTKYNRESILHIKRIFKNEYDETISEYFKFLFDNEIIFFSNQPNLFPEIELVWDEPSIIIQAIIDFNKNSNHNISMISDELNNFNCKNIQLRFFDTIEFDNLKDILNYFEYSTIQGIQILLPFNNNISHNDYFNLKRFCPRVFSITIFNRPVNKKKQDTDKDQNVYIIYTEQMNIDEKSCGVIDRKYFPVNLKTISESQKHNTCLNRKISIDVNGEIKNCPSMQKSFGNIKNTSLTEATEKNGFKNVWYIHKDQIEVCKDCEFRHICTDCRAYIKNRKNIYSQPEKCFYNPYIAKWKDQEDYISVEEWRNQNPNLI